MSTIADGIYAINLPFGGGAITDVGEGRYASLLPAGSVGPDANKVEVKYDPAKTAYSLKFVKSGLYLSYTDEPTMNQKLTPNDKIRYYIIEQSPYEDNKYNISLVENKAYGVGLALERIYPPWLAMLNFPEKQTWDFQRIDSQPKL